ncbi:pimeloyl-ACP methyl ester carboxylesterase [Motilibacter rhizosphaerae]|uniref:Pimeloyl-ACP methyl ester carboxylesterase n=1 Tax=Motilibacter rhizosphaerae TaxID=598652 RepID=A0A4V2F552_9ACTN|nr:alpha/beta hydrolase [Motilibacter rhizosphaerae]RZS91609.1 pimeloyl-ACP methyl ester carboxylesterase [Motilibacter rhizosphaerae]
MSVVHHRTVQIDGHEVFYREAGHPDGPTILLLHGFPTSSSMFRRLITLLARDYHVIAPDHVGFGRSAAPAVTEFAYSFDALARITSGLLDQLGVNRYAIYVQDYGAPVGWRLALEHPDRITAIVTQNGNGYTDGFVEEFWAPVWTYAADPGPDTEPAVRAALGVEAIRWQYLHGVPDPSVVDPDTWDHAAALVSRPGNDQVQLALFRDYATNPPLYPRLHEFLRTSGVPVLAVWGRNDEIFGPAGATAFARDAADAEIHLVDGGHFLLESHLDVVAGYLQGFLGRVLH